MAAAWFNTLADPQKARALSAGTEPGERVHPEVVLAMNEVGIPLAEERPKLLSAAMLADASHLVTMGCGTACPVVPQWVRPVDWPLDDPKGQPIETVRQIRDEVEECVRRLLDEHGWAKPVV
jgi:arsenate reductase